jgi:hypothetical protein
LHKLQHATSNRDTERREVANAKLLVKICKFLNLQRELGFPFPDLADSQDPADNPADFDLLLPLDLSARDHLQIYPTPVIRIEEELLEAAARETLEAVRNTLRARSGHVKFCALNVAGVANSTRTARLMQSIQEEMEVAATNYRGHQQSLFALRGTGEWEDELRPLLPIDVRGMNTDEPTPAQLANTRKAHRQGLMVLDDDARNDVSANHDLDYELVVQRLKGLVQHGAKGRTVSWIWSGQNVVDNDDDPVGERFSLSCGDLQLTCCQP